MLAVLTQNKVPGAPSGERYRRTMDYSAPVYNQEHHPCCKSTSRSLQDLSKEVTVSNTQLTVIIRQECHQACRFASG